MYAAWRTGYSDMYEEDDEDIALMAIEESDVEPESDSEETETTLKVMLLMHYNIAFASSTAERLGKVEAKFSIIQRSKENKEKENKQKKIKEKKGDEEEEKKKKTNKKKRTMKKFEGERKGKN
ncbi:uncharacterized protein [Solanum lycopersicum]|uniref:uncharacterized protein n=1 Tax=Solanum lycopersicum TaxID=4081 RepID=UPI003747D039